MNLHTMTQPERAETIVFASLVADAMAAWWRELQPKMRKRLCVMAGVIPADQIDEGRHGQLWGHGGYRRMTNEQRRAIREAVADLNRAARQIQEEAAQAVKAQGAA